jgi:gamma-glutamylcyclotransferase (GGCT)/AIG2-like uncharacterized protein YtfP
MKRFSNLPAMSASTLPTQKKKKKKKNIFDLGTKYIFVIEPAGKILQGDVYNIYFSMHGILVNLLIT